MKTYQDFEKADNIIDFIKQAINEYQTSDEYKIALIADDYERQQNTTIRNYIKYLYTQTGRQVVDFTAANNKIASNFFHRLNTQRCAYSLGNGISFTNTQQLKDENGTRTVDTTKAALGPAFDSTVYSAAYYALIHRVSYTFWNHDKGYVFPMTEFCPLWDEYDGRLRAGIRFWSLDWQNKPATVVLYTEDGYTKYRTREGGKGLDIVEFEPQKAYLQRVTVSEADGEEVVGESNYGSLPIVPMWGSKHKQSTLVGMRDAIDSYDLIMSGFANDLEECAEIYWIIGNAMGMNDTDVARFRDKLKMTHMAVADTDNSSVTPYTQEVPTNARDTYLKNIRAQIYEDFGALDVHTVAAGATNDHIEAAYQPMDEEADDFEYQVIQYVRQILALIGIEDTPQFKRNRVSNQYEQTQMVMLAAEYLDEESVLNLLPFVTVDKIQSIIAAKDKESAERFRQQEQQEHELEA